MTTPVLRGLAKAYSDSLIDRKEYVRERRQLIDGIVSGDVELVPYETLLEPQDKPAMDRTFSDGDATLEIPRAEAPSAPPRSAQSKPAKNKNRLGLVAALVFVCVVGAAWYFLSTSESIPQSADDTTSSPTKDPTVGLLESFLDEDHWDTVTLDNFTRAWNAQPTSARLALANSALMRRTADMIARRITEEQALFELGAQRDALEVQQRLFELANTLAIENDRIARLTSEWENNSTSLAAESISESTQEADVAPPLEMPAPNTTVADESPQATLEPAASEAVASEPAATMEDAESPAPIEAETAGESEPAPEAGDVAQLAPGPTEKEQEQAQSPTAVVDNGAKPSEPMPLETAPSLSHGESTPPSTEPVAQKQQKRKSSCRAELARTRKPRCRDTLADGLKGPVMVVLPAGSVRIGGSNAEEQPHYEVSIEKPFALSAHEISAAEFKQFCVSSGSACAAQPWSDPQLPVVNVSWNQAIEYTQWLSKTSGATYRLPSEAEWEYAARAGSNTPTAFDMDLSPAYARFSFRGVETTPLPRTDKTVNRNKFRLYHMLGNVREWVLDSWHDDHSGASSDGSPRAGGSNQRVVRGGSYSDGADKVRSAARVAMNAATSDARTGFRVLREVQ